VTADERVYLAATMVEVAKFAASAAQTSAQAAEDAIKAAAEGQDLANTLALSNALVAAQRGCWLEAGESVKKVATTPVRGRVVDGRFFGRNRGAK
jgi:hypothetical protein